MQTIETHKVNECNDSITITVLDEPGQGGACHLYAVDWVYNRVDPPSDQRIVIAFQNAPIPEVGVNGVTHEVLLAIVQHRLEGFQSGKFACEENALALDAVKEAISHLKRRTEKRFARGVEGTHTI